MDRKTFTEDLKKLGVREGMNLMVHSSLRKIGVNRLNGGADMVIDSLLDIIGSQGTLMVPAITGNVKPDQPVFHVRHTPSTVGHLTNALRLRPEALRSLHPVHSVAAIGPRAEFFTSRHLQAGTPWSPETPFGRMIRDNHCHILFLGVNLDYNSCFHALEIEARLPGMHTADSTALHVIDETGLEHGIEHHWHDGRTRRYFSDLEGLLYDHGCLSWGRTGLGLSRLVRAVPMRDFILDLLRTEPWLMTRPPVDNDFIWEP